MKSVEPHPLSLFLQKADSKYSKKCVTYRISLLTGRIYRIRNNNLTTPNYNEKNFLPSLNICFDIEFV